MGMSKRAVAFRRSIRSRLFYCFGCGVYLRVAGWGMTPAERRDNAMPTNQSAQDIIASALSLPADQRLAVIDAVHVSLADPQIDHGPEEDVADVQDAWKAEIARRIADVDNGRVETVPADDAERMIRGDAKPSI